MPSPLRFWKVASIGNDFPLVRSEDVSGDALPALARAMTDRRFGVGGDGLLAFGRDPDGRWRLRMFNPDGTEDFCGNGLRASAWWARERGEIGDEATIRHRDREVSVRISGSAIRTEVGRASYAPSSVPLVGPEIFDGELWAGIESGMPQVVRGSALSTGSTHAIVPVAAFPDDDTFRSLSAVIEHDPKFPERTSVIWSVREADRAIAIRIWERGAGETLGCGTGSAAAAVDFARRRGLGGPISVRNPGGPLTVEFATWDSPLSLTGSAEVVFEGEWLDPV